MTRTRLAQALSATAVSSTLAASTASRAAAAARAATAASSGPRRWALKKIGEGGGARVQPQFQRRTGQGARQVELEGPPPGFEPDPQQRGQSQSCAARQQQ